jgi:predicted small lipoprotein YifL
MKKLVVLVLAVVLVIGITACGKSGGNEEPTPTKKIEETEQEKKLQKEDEDFADEFRHTLEIAAADIMVYDEIAGVIGNSTSEVEIASWGPNGIEYVKDMPNLKTAIDEVYKNASRVAFASEKYKGMKYVVSFKKDGTLTAIGVWR